MLPSFNGWQESNSSGCTSPWSASKGRSGHTPICNIVTLLGAGFDRKGKRFIVMERLDGGTLSQLFGYTTRIRDRRRHFFRKKKKLPYLTVLKYAQQIAAAVDYLHRNAIEGSMILHRDLKPDNIGKSIDDLFFGKSFDCFDLYCIWNDVM